MDFGNIGRRVIGNNENETSNLKKGNQNQSLSQLDRTMGHGYTQQLAGLNYDFNSYENIAEMMHRLNPTLDNQVDPYAIDQEINNQNYGMNGYVAQQQLYQQQQKYQQENERLKQQRDLALLQYQQVLQQQRQLMNQQMNSNQPQNKQINIKQKQQKEQQKQIKSKKQLNTSQSSSGSSSDSRKHKNANVIQDNVQNPINYYQQELEYKQYLIQELQQKLREKEHSEQIQRKNQQAELALQKQVVLLENLMTKLNSTQNQKVQQNGVHKDKTWLEFQIEKLERQNATKEMSTFSTQLLNEVNLVALQNRRLLQETIEQNPWMDPGVMQKMLDVMTVHYHNMMNYWQSQYILEQIEEQGYDLEDFQKQYQKQQKKMQKMQQNYLQQQQMLQQFGMQQQSFTQPTHKAKPHRHDQQQSRSDLDELINEIKGKSRRKKNQSTNNIDNSLEKALIQSSNSYQKKQSSKKKNGGYEDELSKLSQLADDN